jgi:hypothetical protein
VTTTDAVQAGGVLAFASLVLYILRELRPVLKGFTDVIESFRAELFEMRITFAAFLERERIRDSRRRRDSEQPRQHLRTVPVGEFDHDETTDIVKLIEKQREAATATVRGVRPPRKGTHHDGEER